MDVVLIIMIVVALAAVIFMWWYTRGRNHISDDTVLYLNSDEDKVLHPWYNSIISTHYRHDLSDNEVAAMFLRKIFGLDYDPELLVVGEDLHLQYHRITQRMLPKEHFFSIRDSLGIPGEIAIIEDENVRRQLRRSNSYDPSYLREVLEEDLATKANDYLKQVLEFRWNKLRALNQKIITNDQGSYAYVEKWTIPNVEIAQSKLGPRVNLLCSDLEFATLVKRLEAHAQLSELS